MSTQFQLYPFPTPEGNPIVGRHFVLKDSISSKLIAGMLLQ